MNLPNCIHYHTIMIEENNMTENLKQRLLNILETIYLMQHPEAMEKIEEGIHTNLIDCIHESSVYF